MISSLLSLLSSLFPLPSALVLRPSDLDRACLSLLAQGLSQTLLQFSCSSVVHYLIASRLISSLSSLLSSLFPLPSALVLLSRCCSFLRWFFAPVTTNFASGHRLRFQSNLIPGPAECAKRLNNTLLADDHWVFPSLPASQPTSQTTNQPTNQPISKPTITRPTNQRTS